MVKTALQNRQNDHMFDLKSQFSGSWINLLNWKYNPKLAFYAKKNTQTLLKQLEKNFKKVQKTAFLTHKLVKITPQNRQNESFFDWKFDFRWHLSTFRVENSNKSKPFNAEYNV